MTSVRLNRLLCVQYVVETGGCGIQTRDVCHPEAAGFGVSLFPSSPFPSGAEQFQYTLLQPQMPLEKWPFPPEFLLPPALGGSSRGQLSAWLSCVHSSLSGHNTPPPPNPLLPPVLSVRPLHSCHNSFTLTSCKVYPSAWEWTRPPQRFCSPGSPSGEAAPFPFPCAAEIRLLPPAWVCRCQLPWPQPLPLLSLPARCAGLLPGTKCLPPLTSQPSWRSLCL